MPRYVVDMNGFYIVWSTIVDAPVRSCRTFNEALTAAYKYDLTSIEIATFSSRITQYGTTCPERCTPEEMVMGNRAGESESELTYMEIRDECLHELEYKERLRKESDQKLGVKNA
jgi:hypothetical protein